MADNSIDIKFSGSIDELVTAIDQVCKQIEAMVARVNQAMDETVAKMRQSAQEMTGAFANLGKGAAAGAKGTAGAVPRADKGSEHGADKAQRQAEQIEAIHRATSRRINDEALRDKQAELKAEVQAHKISAEEEIAQLKALEDNNFNGQSKQLSNARDGADDLVRKQKLDQQLIELQLKHDDTIKRLDKELAQSQAQSAKQTQDAWSKALSPIESSFEQMLGNVLKGTQSFQQAARKAFESAAMAEIQSDLKALAQHEINNFRKVESDKKTEQGGLLYTLFTQNAKTAAVKQGVAQQTAAENSGFLSWLGHIPEALGQFLGLESTKTDAVEAGTTARTALQTTADQSTMQSSGSTAISSLGDHAASAAAGAADSQAGIPYVGPVLAAAAAASILALVMGFAGHIHSAAGGMYEVPGEILSVLHPQESVIPAAIAGPMRQFFEGGLSAGASGGGTGPGGGAGGGQTIVISPQVSAMDGRSVLAALNDPQTMRGMATQLASYWRLNPSSRPAF